MSLRRALVAFAVSAAVAAVSLYLVIRFTDGFKTVQGILGTVVGSALVLMVLLARAGQEDAARADEGPEGGVSGTTKGGA